MRRGKAIAVLGAVLDGDGARAQALLATLTSLKGMPIGPARLRGLVPDGREDLALNALVASGAVRIAPGVLGQGIVEADGLDWLTEHLEVYLEAIADRPRLAPPCNVELAWTLPAGLLSEFDDPPAQSLAALMRSVIASAQQRLYLHSPFLDPQGARLLLGPTAGAARRGVAVSLISHGLDEPGSPGAAALQVFRDEIPDLRAYTAPKTEPGPGYLLLHAKLVVADGRRAVLASANLTRYALQTHLEVGVGLEGNVAAQLDILLNRVMASHLIRQVS